MLSNRLAGRQPGIDMLVASIALFLLAVALGARLAFSLFRKVDTDKGVALAHGLAAVVGVAALIAFAAKNPNSLLYVAIGVFVLAAFGGGMLFFNDLRGRPDPLPLVVIHAALAAVGLGIVLVVAFG